MDQPADPPTEKTCTKCHKTKPLDAFHKRTKNKTDGRQPKCKECFAKIGRDWRQGNAERATSTAIAWQKANPEKVREIRRKSHLKRMGLTPESYERRLAEQGGRCAGCGTTDPGTFGVFVIDHDHTCCPGGSSCGECLRGLLCNGCNRVLGFVKDDVAALEGLVTYLRGYWNGLIAGGSFRFCVPESTPDVQGTPPTGLLEE